MNKNYRVNFEDIQQISTEDYSEEEFALVKMGFLSTRPNSHGLHISEEVLRASAPSVLGKWIVADMSGMVDARGHSDKERIMGYVPSNQQVEFVYDNDGYLRAYVEGVISKVYATDFCTMFVNDNERAVSVEMTVETPEDDEYEVLSFNIVGTTVLGKMVNPSCPQSNIVFTRFSEDEANEFFTKVNQDSLTALKKFEKQCKVTMAEKKTYKIDKSKEAVSDKPWGEVDKTELRNKIMEASNRASLVKAVYMLVEEGWQDAPSEHLKYPVMELKGDTFVYNKGGLASALGYAKKENETAVINKIEKIYKKLELDSSRKEDTTKMSKEIEFAAVDIGDMWGKLWDAIYAKDINMCIEGIYEEDNQKFAILKTRSGDLYRLDFSFTEEGLTLSDTMVQVEKEFVPGNKILTFAEPENVEDYRKFSDDDDDDKKDDEDDNDKDDDKDDDDDSDDDDKDVKMSYEELESKCAQMAKDIEDRDNIIMDKDAELAELRAFKEGVETKEKAMSVEAVMAEIKEFVSDEQAKEFREEGLACKMSELDAWKNKVKAVSFEAAKGSYSKKTNKSDVWAFSAPISTQSVKKGLWD